jgi:phosphate:Na+ symporter
MSLQWSSLFGGLGLFLWGMHMLSQGLRLAAGARLEAVLARATHTRFRGLVSGAVTTAIVQSSSAVTVATIGFVNANLLMLGSAIWVLFGANLGTTATGWIVAFAGLKVDFSVFALPLIALGAALKLAGEKRPVAAWGEAVAGFGLLFYGIVLMQSGFADVSANWQIPQSDGMLGMALQALIGVAMTVIMQSSSASTAIALTAAQSGLIDVTGAAAVVIGANIGTTVTAVLASLGATPNAKRVAAAHVLFNVITAIAAFVVLPWLIPSITSIIALFDRGQAPATTLAIFNTLFNALGILLMWPFVPYLTRKLQSHFAGVRHAGAMPQFLDQTTLPVPGLAVRALASELERMLALARESIWWSLPSSAPRVQGSNDMAAESNPQDLGQAEQARHDLKRLLAASEDFVEQMSRVAMDGETGERLACLLRVRRYLDNVVEGETEALVLSNELAPLSDLQGVYEKYWHSVRELLSAMALESPHTPERLAPLTKAQESDLERRLQAGQTGQPGQEQWRMSGAQYTLEPGYENDQGTAKKFEAYELAYQCLKHAMLQAGADGRWRLDRMERSLRAASNERRALQQLVKAEQWLARGRAENRGVEPDQTR